MDQIIQTLVDDIDSKIASLQAAKDALIKSTGAGTNGTSVSAQSALSVASSVVPSVPIVTPIMAHSVPTTKKKRVLSAEARKSISEASRKRWADRRKQAAAKLANRK